MPQRPRIHRPRTAKATKKHDSDARRKLDPLLAYAVKVRNSHRWHKLRRWKQTNSPLCEDPYGIHRDKRPLMAVVDHIIPIAERPDMAYDSANLQSLCKGCNDRKTAQERRQSPSPGPSGGYGGPISGGSPADTDCEIKKVNALLTKSGWGVNNG